MKEPTREEWKQLYEAAGLFAREKPWEWLEDEEPIAIENPEDGEMGYAVVLGAAGEQLGLALYLGDEGYDAYCRIQAGEIEPDALEAMIIQRAATLMLADRQHLDKDERALIKKLGFRFRGRSAWPMFRSLEPGYAPWFLDGAQARFLTLALYQTIEVYKRVRNGDLALFDEDDPELVLTLLNRDGRWREEWRRPPAWLQPLDPVPDISERSDVAQLADSPVERAGLWEVGVFRLSEPVASGVPGERPYFPVSMMAIETGEGMLLGHELMDQPQPSAGDQQEAFLKILAGLSEHPLTLRTDTEELAEILAPIASAVGFELELGPLPFLSYARERLELWLERGY